MSISSESLQKLLPLLTEHLNDEKDCKAYLIKSLGTDETISERIAWNTSKDIFITVMVKELENFGKIAPGKTALCALLTEICKNVGLDKQERLNEVILELQGIHTSPHLLFDLLLDMDFKQQVQLVKTTMVSCRTSAFLVHGEANYGQDLLVTKLFRLTSTWKNNSPIKINAAYLSVDRLRRQLARSLSLPTDTQLPEIINKICDRWQTKDVILLFDKVDCVSPQVLSKWLQEFWEPMVTAAEQNPPLKETHLLMFLVDNCGNVSTSNTVQVNQFHQLPRVSPFPLDILDEWIDKVSGMQSVQTPATLNSQVLLKQSDNGIPQFIYEEICQSFGHNWEGGLAKWLI